ncbi:MAG: P-type conjugative transfer protein TrbG [Phenylobacterium sp.]|jgi:type IV secretion system protein VirB9|uniref:P-type conjugative transfer protein TrbG n=2 Tax=unclassified Phenylobacterium TaxID=2640670 RepID=UPI0008AC4A1A|nr:P-type conjugative transfer protein TrbG [Phenylobacterium sp. RIFCSPHIGHO2_01_FULL_69_31]MBJ7410184.1 P-type conjugative transfer protein TrbG [Phenylobacterium sp.]OHB28378.1 MAG: P-type conjugative transfer protein TrbG [Phenylobacterium sp. RIFCSPHIGHO2_01_FULL_69_31]
MRASTLILMLAGTALSGCATMQAEQSKRMSTVAVTAPALAPAPVPRRPIVVASTPVPNPPERPARRPRAGPVRRAPESSDPAARVARANAAARVQPTGSAYANAAQIYPYADGALFQVYTAPGRITDITLEEGETLSGTGPVAAGDTVRWIIGDTESGSGPSRRVHILVKPTRADLQTNLVINTNRRTYHLELRATPATYMASVAWRYPADEALAAAESVERYAAPTVAIEQLNFNYKISGDRPSWRPVRVFDDGRQTFIEFGLSVTQGELPPLFVSGADGKAADLVNYRVSGQRMVVDRLFTRAELRLGDRRGQKRVRIERGAGG